MPAQLAPMLTMLRFFEPPSRLTLRIPDGFGLATPQTASFKWGAIGQRGLLDRQLSHQHNRAPEVQTTGDTTPVQQIVYAESLTISGGSNA